MYRDEIITNIDEGTVKAKFHHYYVEILLCGGEFGLYEMVINTDDFEDVGKEISFENFSEVFDEVFDDIDWACFPDDEETAKYWLDKWNAFDADIEFDTSVITMNEQLRELFNKNFK